VGVAVDDELGAVLLNNWVKSVKVRQPFVCVIRRSGKGMMDQQDSYGAFAGPFQTESRRNAPVVRPSAAGGG
jgi:hypothetical protein